MIALIVFVFSFLSIAEVSECKKMVERTLKPGVTLQENASDHGWRFQKDEKSALKFMAAYDVSKLSIDHSIQSGKDVLKDCKYFSNKTQSCDDLFQNYNFLRGLLHGIKNNGWSPSTVEVGKRNVLSYLVEVATKTDAPPIHLLLALDLLSELNPLSPESQITLMQIQSLHRDLSKALPPNKDKKVNCKSFQATLKAERDIANTYRPKFADLLKDLKP